MRDKYIDLNGQVYENLTSLLQKVTETLPLHFHRFIYYDIASHERRIERSTSPAVPPLPEDSELTNTAPQQGGTQREPPVRTLARWTRELTDVSENSFYVLFYLDKLIEYRQTGYTAEEKELLIWLEKLIENITENNRLIMVALRDTMVPLELYTSSPKTYLQQIPMPDKEDRLAYLRRQLGQQPHLELIADLTDGLFLRDLDNITREIKKYPELSTRELRRLINKYRIGEQEDHWSNLSIEKLDRAFRWFVEEEGVKGQDEAVRAVIDVLCLARAGLSGVASGTSAKPRGFCFFAGPTGVGKTFLAKKLAKFLFGTEEAFLRFDMSEFKEEHTVSKFIGSPPGYVGYEQGGMLTNAVRQRPFSVILFDEIEKAHPKIMDIFLQILDEGRLTDSRGQTVFFTETVIIFTSNIGTRTTDSRGNPISEREHLDKIIEDTSLSYDEKKKRIHEHFVRAVEQFFMFEISRPELLNRIGNNIVPFNYIHTPEVQKEIVCSHLKRIKEDFEDRYRGFNYKLEFDETVPQFLVNKYAHQMERFGGRGITNAIEEEIMKPLAKETLAVEGMGATGVKFYVTSQNGMITIRQT